jgi:TetR/AcrR family transcriptional repressor of nem operon
VRGAARLFRERGIAAVGIDALMEHAGLTHGGFYAHFRNKDALVGDAIRTAFGDAQAALFGVSPGEGCALPALAAEVSRLRGRPRRLFAEELDSIVGCIAGKLGGPEATVRRRALRLLSGWAGAILLARVASSPEMARQTLEACGDDEPAGAAAPDPAVPAARKVRR